jgi:hypothetical protein
VTISSGALVVRPDSVFLIMHATYEGARTTSLDINDRYVYTQHDNGDIVVGGGAGAAAVTLANVIGDRAVAQRRMAIAPALTGAGVTEYWGGKFVFSFVNAPPGSH